MYKYMEITFDSEKEGIEFKEQMKYYGYQPLMQLLSRPRFRNIVYIGLNNKTLAVGQKDFDGTSLYPGEIVLRVKVNNVEA